MVSGAPAEELVPFGPKEISVNGIADVGAQAPMQVLAAARYTVAGLRRPPFGRVERSRAWPIRIHQPSRLVKGFTHCGHVGIAARDPLRHRLESAEGPVELASLRDILGGPPQSLLGDTQLDRANRQGRPFRCPEFRRRIAGTEHHIRSDAHVIELDSRLRLVAPGALVDQ